MSYLIEFAQDFFRVKHVTGWSNDVANYPPIKMGEVSRKPTNKIICGDWPWHANRTITDPRAEWHNDNGRCYENMLDGDGHTQYFQFPKETDNWFNSPAPDAGFLWW